MRFRRLGPGATSALVGTGALAIWWVSLALGPLANPARDSLPTELTNRQFWTLIADLSEPGGTFRSNSGSPDNLLSNESGVSTAAGELGRTVKPSGVYLGVGPEQNFSYIAAIRPRIAFVTDIRRGNLHVHLMYKALFETSTNRADFVSRLFSRPRPDGLTARMGAADLMNAFLAVPRGDEILFAANLKAVLDHLTITRELPLDAGDRAGIEYVYRQFQRFGPALNYTSSIDGRTGSAISYANIMATTDVETGAERGYLANEQFFGVVKALQNRNLVVPIVGDFAGPKALRAIGRYLRAHDATVTAFYVSNVEVYLQRNNVWPAFCANVATLPLDEFSVFVKPAGSRSVSLRGMAADTAGCK